MHLDDELFDWLTGLDEKQLAALLAKRPDVLGEPWPRRLSAVADRLASARSMIDATRSAATPEVQVLRAVQLCLALEPGDPSVAEVARWLGATTAQVESYVDSMSERALAWPAPDGRIAVPEVLHNDGIGFYGLGQPIGTLLAESTTGQLSQLAGVLGIRAEPRKSALFAQLVKFFRDADGVRALVASGPQPARDLLAELAFDGPERDGLVDRIQYGAGAAGIAWAFRHCLLLGTNTGSGYMPLEVALALRGPGYHLPFTPERPEFPTADVGVERVEAESSAAALRLLDRITTVVDAAPLPLLKDGSVGIRTIKKLSKDTGGSVDEITLAVTVAIDTGLLDYHEPEVPPARRGARKPPPLPPPTLELGQKPIPADPAVLLKSVVELWWAPNALDPDFPENADSGAYIRQLTLRLLAEIPPGTASLDAAAFDTLTAWHAPMLPKNIVTEFGHRSLAEAGLLGLVASGAASQLGRALAAGRDLSDAAGALVSRARTTALFGTDLTAIVTGSPDARLAALLDRAADREAQGSATSWRFSPATVRRAFDQGATTGKLLEELGSAAQGELPQPLVYLINDVARRHGEAQVIGVASVVVGEDPTVLTEIAAHRKLAKLGLRAVAPTVLTSTVDAAGTLAALREAGYAPIHRDTDGTLLVPGRETPEPGPEPVSAEPAHQPRVEDPVAHAARLLAARPTGTPLRHGQLTKALSDRHNGRLSADYQRMCWQLEGNLPVSVVYREPDGTRTDLHVLAPELDDGALDVWSVDEHKYRRLELDRIEVR
ncbi:helicase-associated domain-containing protein [Amycolatopsis sp. H20-H5]|uniref:helicase-associated domain-containing protein n=1 Tax=Amycolatopsis sp. H20-H5 TaxID=3046309 RepID=UPI002DC02725|nr:helicase-associated domain-containing protein [Amycolatopsis sp. H20-H5]MEC3977953.1 helicase-associated domain-containing protein [Amycolatopsis sp. H20-H5]